MSATQSLLQRAEEPKVNNYQVEPGLNIKDKQNQEENGGPDVSKSFNEKAKANGIGLESTNHSKMEREFVGQTEDIVHNHIWQPDVSTHKQYQNIRNQRLRREKERKEMASVAYSNIQDDRFNLHENDLFGNDLNNKAKFFKSCGASYYGANGYRRAFSRRNRHVLQNSDVTERGLDGFKKKEIKDTIKGHRNTEVDYRQIEDDGGYTLDCFKNRKTMKAVKSHHGLNFDVITEYNVRNDQNLMFGRQRKNVDSQIEKYKKKYTDNNSHNSGAIRNVAGRFRGGFERRNMLNQAQKANSSQPEHEFSIATKHRLNLESYYYDFGNDQNADALIDQDKKDDEYKDSVKNIQI